MKIEDIDPLLTALSEEFGVPKPNYCIFQVKPLKKLDPLWRSKYLKAVVKGGGGFQALPMGASFYPFGKQGFLTLLVRKSGQIRRENVVHEFFHYLHWIQESFKPTIKLKKMSLGEFFWKLLNNKPTDDTLEEVMQYAAEIYEEEKMTKRETRKWLREHPHTREEILRI